MQPGINKSINSLNSKLLLGLLACMIYRVITISISLTYSQFFNSHKINISTNLYGFYLYLILVVCIFMFAVSSNKIIGFTIAVGSILFLGGGIYKSDFPYRAMLFVFSAFWAYLFIFISNSQLKEVHSESHISKTARYFKYTLLIVYPVYIFFEMEAFRNVSLFIACVIFLMFFISWLDRKLQ